LLIVPEIAAMNATLIIASVMTIQQADGDPCGAPRCTPIANSENLEKSLDDAIAIMTKLDRQNRMLEKCVKFTATLRHLLQNNLACQLLFLYWY
jgi:hypothetical protein